MSSYIIVLKNFREQYNLLLDHLMKNRINFHTHKPNIICPLRKVIQNLHPTTLHEDIITGLSELRHNVTKFHNIKSFSDKARSLNFFCQHQKSYL